MSDEINSLEPVYDEKIKPMERMCVVSPETWTETLKLLKNTYTLSVRETCNVMQSSRQWVSKYIRPYIPSIYLSTGYYIDKKTKKRERGISWAALALKQIGRTEEGGTSSTWLNRSEFDHYILNHIESVTAQTKNVPLDYFMSDKDAKQWASECKKLMERIDALENNLSDIENSLNDYNQNSVTFEMDLKNSEIYYAKIELNNLYKEYITDEHVLKIISDYPNMTKRTESSPCTVCLPKYFSPSRSKWRSVHDMKGYGGTEEEVMRKLFLSGSYRIALKLPDKDGVIGEKVYYIPDPEPINPKALNMFTLVKLSRLRELIGS